MLFRSVLYLRTERAVCAHVVEVLASVLPDVDVVLIDSEGSVRAGSIAPSNQGPVRVAWGAPKDESYFQRMLTDAERDEVSRALAHLLDMPLTRSCEILGASVDVLGGGARATASPQLRFIHVHQFQLFRIPYTV